MLGKHQYLGSPKNYGKPGRLRSKIMTVKERWTADNILPGIFERVEAEREGGVLYIVRKWREKGKIKTLRLLIKAQKNGQKRQKIPDGQGLRNRSLRSGKKL